jgi:hypothetical protein
MGVAFGTSRFSEEQWTRSFVIPVFVPTSPTPAGLQLLYSMSPHHISLVSSATPFDQPEMESLKRSASNGTNTAVALGHPGLFTAERSINGGQWIPMSRISKIETDSFHRLMARVCAGEIDPREHIADSTSSRDVRLVALSD